MSSSSKQPYSVRAKNHPNPLVRKLFAIAEAKKTNVTVSADVTTTKQLLDLADRTPPISSVAKTGSLSHLYRTRPLHRRLQNPHRHPLRLQRTNNHRLKTHRRKTQLPHLRRPQIHRYWQHSPKTIPRRRPTHLRMVSHHQLRNPTGRRDRASSNPNR